MELSTSQLIFHLHWLRETGRDQGTLVRLDELDPSVRKGVLKAAQGAGSELDLKLPYLDRRELRRRTEVLGLLTFRRRGTEIAPILKPRLALRTLAADLALMHPAWKAAPAEGRAAHFRVWQQVSRSLQRSIRDWIADEYFRDIRVCEDRDAAYPVIVYQAARIFRGYAPLDFTYDILNYPARRDTLEVVWRMTGAPTQLVMADLERRLNEAGLHALARRYSPRWHEDVLVEVRRRPRGLVDLLAAESELIDAIINLGSARTPHAVCVFAKSANKSLRSVGVRDYRRLARRALRETTRILEEIQREEAEALDLLTTN